MARCSQTIHLTLSYVFNDVVVLMSRIEFPQRL